MQENYHIEEDNNKIKSNDYHKDCVVKGCILTLDRFHIDVYIHTCFYVRSMILG